MAILRHYKLDVAGKLVCVIGRSSIVGKPMAALLLQSHATVIQCHSQTPDLKTLTRQADFLIVAMGKMEMIDETYVRPGTVVIDVGMHRNSQDKVVGDVLYEKVAAVASAMTPVPGGVGPMTIAILMQNTVLAAELRAGN
jgi:methylenetetrahydrofolate dehydrogenase (NADP+)/methenyltetrahydrofolate cyclohydrolase